MKKGDIPHTEDLTELQGCEYKSATKDIIIFCASEERHPTCLLPGLGTNRIYGTALHN